MFGASRCSDVRRRAAPHVTASGVGMKLWTLALLRAVTSDQL